MTLSEGPKKGLGNPVNIIFLFLCVVVFGMGVQVSIANQHFIQVEQKMNSLTAQVKIQEEQNHKQNLALLHEILNATKSRPH